MRTVYQEGQKVQTPDGSGTITEIIGEKITVKLEEGEQRTFSDDDLTDESAVG